MRIDVVERQIEKIYDGYSLPPELRGMLENQLESIIDIEQAKFSAVLSALQKEKEKLEHKRKKLLEAHYFDAITKRLDISEHDIKMHNTAHEEVRRRLTLALDLIKNCGQAYRQADDTTKLLLNQAIFKRFYICNEGIIKAELAEPFDQIIPPIIDGIARINHAKSCDNDRLTEKQCATSSFSLDVAILLGKIKVLTRTNQNFLIRKVRVRTFWWTIQDSNL